MKLSEIATVVDGMLHDDPGAVVTGGASLDSRVVELGGLFVACVGEHVDGHDYALEAARNGAAAVLATRPVGVPAVVVEDVTVALGRLAHHLLGLLPELTVVALTGSQGKTGTKDLLGAILGRVGATVATAGSFNNELGLPLTVLRADQATRYLVLEMGARGVGHLRYLCDIAPPDVALVLNVGKAHLGEFGSQEGIARAKAELVDALRDTGTAVLNADDALVSAMATRTPARVVTFGESAGADVRVVGLHLDALGRAEFDLLADGTTASVRLQLLGAHQAGNAAAAAAVATSVGIPLAVVAGALEDAAAASRWRMQLSELDTGVTVLNDAYNANPDSMRAALETLAAIASGRSGPSRTVAVLGEMRELGESSEQEHEALGALAVRLGIDQLVVAGPAARPIHRAACLAGSWVEEPVSVGDNEEATRWLRGHLRPGDVVLFKASRAAGLEQVAEAIVRDALGPSVAAEPRA